MTVMLNILIIDDDPGICKLLANSLKHQKNFQVSTCSSGKDAINFIESQNLHIVVIDISLPDMDGFRVMDQMHQKDPETKVIMMTGYATVESAIKALRLGAYDYLTKPFELEKFIKTLENAARLIEAEYTRKNAEMALQNRTRDLDLRVRELSCLYQISDIVNTAEISLEVILKQVVDLIPHPFQYPENTWARIQLDTELYQTGGFRTGDLVLSHDISVYGYTVGSLEVHVRKTNDWFLENNYFLEEEKALIHNIAGKIGRIIENVETEKSLKESEETARAILNATTDAALLLNALGEVQSANTIACQWLDLRRDAIIGQNYPSLVHGEVQEFRKEKLDQVMLTGQPVIFEDECEGRFFHHSLYPVRNAEGKVNRVAVYIRDITEKKEAEKELLNYQRQLQILSSELLLTEERERRKIATDLHDRIGQTLIFSKIQLGTLKGSGLPPHLLEPMEEVLKLIEQTIQDTRSLIFELSPPVLYELGLMPAVEWIAEQIQKQHHLRIRIHDDGISKNLHGGLRVHLFQAIREILINAAKHSRAKNVWVSMHRLEEKIQIEIWDDGVGFDTSQIRQGGFGLFSIRERLNSIGGELKVESASGKGTRIVLTSPLKYPGLHEL